MGEWIVRLWCSVLVVSRQAPLVVQMRCGQRRVTSHQTLEPFEGTQTLMREFVSWRIFGNVVPKNDASSFEMLKALGLFVEAFPAFFRFYDNASPTKPRRGE